MIRIARLLAAMFKPVGGVVMSAFFIPIYRTGFASRRQMTHWYRPVKNRFMFFVTNKVMMHVAMTGVVIGTVVINLGMDPARAESIDAFNKSLAYAVITRDQSLMVEEFANTDMITLRGNVTGYLSPASIAVPVGSIDEGMLAQMRSTSLAGGGSLSTPIMASSSASVAPRDGIETYTVTDGDVLSTIAQRFGVSMNTILWANNLTLRSTLKLGQQLSILPTSGLLYTVKSGDNLTKIATKLNADAVGILAMNKLTDASQIVIGKTLIIPGGTPVAVVITPIRPSASSVKGVFVATPKTAGARAISASSRMLWPTDSRTITPGRGLSWFHTGIDIDCNGSPNGTSTQDNYAAADGKVTFAGWNAGGYGNFVVIDHGSGLKTRYGHNYSLYVKTGQYVAAGTPIGRCGSTGRSSGTHLHFEVVGAGGARDFRNPLQYIR